MCPSWLGTRDLPPRGLQRDAGGFLTDTITCATCVGIHNAAMRCDLLLVIPCIIPLAEAAEEAASASAESQARIAGVTSIIAHGESADALASIGLPVGVRCIVAIPAREDRPVRGLAALSQGSDLRQASDDTGRDLGVAAANLRLLAATPATTLIEIALPNSPAPTATVISLTGSVTIFRGGSEVEWSCTPPDYIAGRVLTFGPTTATILAAGPSPAPRPGEDTWELSLSWTGAAVLDVRADHGGKPMRAALLHAHGRDILQLAAVPDAKTRLTITGIDKVEAVAVPIAGRISLGGGR